MRAAALALACALALPAAAPAAVCPAWGPPQLAGELDHALINEASGLAASRAHAGRLYHHNDSGDAARFFVTDLAGGAMRTVNVTGFTPIDVEDMTLGPCGTRTCLVLGDIGDNAARRPEVALVLIEEKARFGPTEKPLRIVRARYPDRPHDAEGLALHPNGDLYLITKPIDFPNRKAGVAQLFKLTAAQLADASQVQTFAEVGTIDLPFLLYEHPLRGQLATGFDIAPDGSGAVILTYTAAVELGFDVAGPWKPSRSWAPGTDFRIVPIPRLPQAEAVAWLPDGSGFLYDTEYLAPFGSAPLYRNLCAKP